MLAWIKSAGTYCKLTFESCMRDKAVNSRFVYLGTFVVTSLLMVYHTVVYLHFKTHDPNYPTIMTVLGGTHAGNALGRMLTKAADKAPDGNAQTPDSPPVSPPQS